MMGLLWTAIKEAYRSPTSVKVLPQEVCFVKDGSDPCIPHKAPDVLVEMGREMASSLLAHPEKYSHAILGNQVLVVDDASYEALFYLFSGKTRSQLWTEKQAVAALFLGRYCVMSTKLYEDARRGAEGMWD